MYKRLIVDHRAHAPIFTQTREGIGSFRFGTSTSELVRDYVISRHCALRPRRSLSSTTQI